MKHCFLWNEIPHSSHAPLLETPAFPYAALTSPHASVSLPPPPALVPRPLHMELRGRWCARWLFPGDTHVGSPATGASWLATCLLPLGEARDSFSLLSLREPFRLFSPHRREFSRKAGRNLTHL